MFLVTQACTQYQYTISVFCQTTHVSFYYCVQLNLECSDPASTCTSRKVEIKLMHLFIYFFLVCKPAALNMQTEMGVVVETHIYYAIDIIVKVAGYSCAVS